MKGLGIGLLVWVLVAVASPYGSGAGAGLFLGALAAYFVWRMDGLDRRLKRIESVDAAVAPALAPTAIPILMPPPAPPAQPPAAEPASASPGRPAAVTPAVVAPAPAPRTPLIRIEDLEALLAGRLLAVVGGLALVIGIIFFLGLAFSRGWIGPEGRVILGLVVGTVLYMVGARFLLLRGNRTREILAHVLLAVGLAIITLGLLAATRLYGLMAPELGVGGALIAAAVASAVAIRARSQLVAGFGLVAVLAAPPVMGASATLLTIVFLGVALAGTTAICLYASWRWLPPVAFLLTVPQLASYVVGTPALGIALVALLVFWALSALSAAGEEVRRPSQRLGETSATLIVGNAAFVVWAGFALLSGTLEEWRGLYLVGVAAAHGALGSFFLLRNGERHPFGMLVFGSGVAALTLAIPVQLGGSWVPMAWAAEAVALGWVYARRNHLYAGGAAAVLGALALGHLLSVEYPLNEPFRAATNGAVPFINSSGAALAFVTLAAAVAVYLLPRRAERVGVAGVMALVVGMVLPYEIGGLWLVTTYALMTAGALLTEQRWLRVSIVVDVAAIRDARGWATAVGDRVLYVSAMLSGIAGLLLALYDYLPLDRFATGLQAFAPFAERPFLDDRTLATAILVATALLVGFGAGDRLYRFAGCVAAAIFIGYLIPFELGAAWSVVAWLSLGLTLQILGSRWDLDRQWNRWTSYGFAAAALIEAFGVVAAPDRLIVRSAAFPDAAIFNGGILAVAAVVAAFATRALLAPGDRDARIAALVAGASGVYLLSIGTVDLFQASLGGSVAFEELRKQAQVALSVLWAILGVAAFVIGLVRRLPRARLFGLGLLAIVTAKVFILDLAGLDVAYRVLSFVALGILLLGAAYLASRLQPDRPPNTDPG